MLPEEPYCYPLYLLVLQGLVLFVPQDQMLLVKATLLRINKCICPKCFSHLPDLNEFLLCRWYFDFIELYKSGQQNRYTWKNLQREIATSLEGLWLAHLSSHPDSHLNAVFFVRQGQGIHQIASQQLQFPHDTSHLWCCAPGVRGLHTPKQAPNDELESRPWQDLVLDTLAHTTLRRCLQKVRLNLGLLSIQTSTDEFVVFFFFFFPGHETSVVGLNTVCCKCLSAPGKACLHADRY